MKKLVSMLISISMIFAMLPTFVIAEEGTLPTYNSNANFSTSAGDGTWDNGVWRAEYYNSSEDNYGTMSSVYDNGYAIDTWTWNQPIVFGDKLRGQNADTLVQHPVRTFIAPKKGTIKINAAEITQGTWSEIEYKIKHNDETKWTITSWNGGNISQPEQTLEVNKGDLIRFEVIMKATTTYGHDQSWTNEIVYTYIEPDATPTPTLDPNKNTFNSATDSENITASGDGTWGCGVWRAEYYNSSEDNYGTMSSVYDNGYAIDTWTWNQPVVFGDKLRGQNADTLVQHPVRTFIAPKKGIIKINAAEITQGTWSEIEYKIKHNDETKWNTISTEGGVVSQPEQILEVNKDDLIRFEVIMKATTTYGHDQSWTNNISYVDPVKETTPTIEIDYENEKLTGFGEGSYTIGGTAVTPENGSLAVAAYMGTTIEIVKKGNDKTTIDSEAQSLLVPECPAVPTASDITVTQPTVIDGTGSISGMIGMEYKLSSAESWTECTENEITGLKAGAYDIRVKATDKSFKSDTYSVKINEFVPLKEATPAIAIDYENEKLTGFSDGSYTIGGATVTLESGELAVDSYMGTTIKIVKKGNGTITIDSEEQSLQIPTRPTAPSVSAIDETIVGANDGKITGVTDAMEYKLSSAQEWATVGSGLTELTNLAPGSYNVRYKATSSSFVSLSETVAINAQGVQEPIVTVPTLADTIYTDGMKLLNISLEGIQIPSGNTPGAFTWKTPNMLVNAGDNQSFDAVFTPADTNNFKITDLQIPVNIKPATITGITVTGYEGKSDGTAHSVTVTGTRAGDTVTYKVDSGEFTDTVPSYTEVCEHSVTVKVSRANYNDFTQEVKIKITAAPTPEPTLEPTSEPTASPTTEPTTEPTQTTYISNEKFNTSTADGKWDGGIWSAQCYVQDWWIYSDLTNVADGKYNLEWLENGLARVDGNTLETDTTIKNFTVRAFTAPQKGILRIEKATITNASAAAAKVQIRHKANNGDLKHIWKTGATEIVGNGTTEQEPIELQVNEGDIIYFEAASASEGTGVIVEWINKLTYIDEFTPEPTPTPTPKPTPAPPLEDGTYKSSHNFIPEEGSGIWENVWSAEIYNSADGTYADAKTEYSGGYAQNNTDEKQPVIYGNRMRVTGADTPEKHPVRKFTVPKDGKLRILQSEITHKTWEEIQYNIKLNNTVIWTETYSDSGAKLIQPEQRLQDVKAGDVIRFEAILKEGTSYGYEQLWENTILYWDGTEPTPTPIPTPTPDPDFNKTLYRASDSWSMEENGDNVWKWQSYNVTSKTYEDLTKTMESNLSMGDDWSDGPVWLAGDDWRWSAVGKYTMRVTVDPGDPTSEETSGDFKVHRDYPVRTFTSPKNGTVSIQAPDNKIWAKDESTGTHIRIMCQRADGSKPIQIFPNAEETDWLNIKGEYNFEPIEFEINAGDKLMFENAFIWKEGGYSPWNTYVQWDPIVEYKTISPKLTGVIPADGAENIALNAEHILNYDGALADISADKLTVYEVNSEGENIKSDAVCSSIAVDGSSVKFVLDGLKPYTKYEAKLDGICYFGFNAKNEKSETITFTTGPAVNIGEAKYENGKVSVPVNNPYKENKTATLIAAVCKGTESKYSIEKTYYVTRRDIGANDVIETEAEFPSDSDYFIKIVVMEDMQKARAYAPASIIRR